MTNATVYYDDNGQIVVARPELSDREFYAAYLGVCTPEDAFVNAPEKLQAYPRTNLFAEYLASQFATLADGTEITEIVDSSGNGNSLSPPEGEVLDDNYTKVLPVVASGKMQFKKILDSWFKTRIQGGQESIPSDNITVFLPIAQGSGDVQLSASFFGLKIELYLSPSYCNYVLNFEKYGESNGQYVPVFYESIDFDFVSVDTQNSNHVLTIKLSQFGFYEMYFDSALRQVNTFENGPTLIGPGVRLDMTSDSDLPIEVNFGDILVYNDYMNNATRYAIENQIRSSL